MYVVIGSGPAGVMCASALVDKGLPVTLLDAGRDCEPEKIASVRELARRNPEDWTSEMLRPLAPPLTDVLEVPTKLAYGSDFPYALDELDSVVQHNARCTLSLAKGGLSNVWGAAMLPNPVKDFKSWPLSFEEMKAAYRAVAEIVGIAGRYDDLAVDYPFFSKPDYPPALSVQAQHILKCLENHRDMLDKQGIKFGQARLAIKVLQSAESNGCQYCGMCLEGCPYGVIYNTRHTLRRLCASDRFVYRSGLVARRVGENNHDGAFVNCEKDCETGEEIIFGKKIFLACGTLSTTRIIMNSVGVFPDRLSICFQPYFFLPMVSRKNFSGVIDERLHTLAQLFIEVEDNSISHDVVHLQLYTYNSLLRRRLQALTLGLKPVETMLERHVLGRLLVLQGYMTGNGSEITVSPSRSRSSAGVNLNLSGDLPDSLTESMKRLCRKLRRNTNCIGAFPVTSLLKIGVPGDGNHIAGVFPMRCEPQNWESDRLGRVSHFSKIHMVDGTVLPSLPATTITYTIMANAYRIGSEVGELGIREQV